MLSDQRSDTFKRSRRAGFGAMLGPSLQQGMFARTAPITQRGNARRAVNYAANPGTGFGVKATGMPPGRAAVQALELAAIEALEGARV